MKTIKIGDIQEEHVGQTFFGAYGAVGFVEEITIIRVNGDEIIHRDSDGSQAGYVRWAHKDFELYLDKREAQNVVDDYIYGIEKSMDTPDKLMNYVFNQAIAPVSYLSYHDIVGEIGLSDVEMRIFKLNVKKFFGINLKEETE